MKSPFAFSSPGEKEVEGGFEREMDIVVEVPEEEEQEVERDDHSTLQLDLLESIEYLQE